MYPWMGIRWEKVLFLRAEGEEKGLHGRKKRKEYSKYTITDGRKVGRGRHALGSRGKRPPIHWIAERDRHSSDSRG
jgi:hypothetical protein